MKSKIWSLLGISLLVMGTAPAMAKGMFEVRAGVGLNGTSPDDLNDQAAGLDFGSFDNYNLDVFWNLPGPIGLGVRGEWLNDKQSTNGPDAEIDVTNVTALVDFRFLDNNLFYVGAIGGVGYPWGDLKGFGGKDTSLDSGNLTYTLGGEAGLRLGRFILGAELGYTNLRLETDDGSTSVDLSGFYGKAMVGIGLF